MFLISAEPAKSQETNQICPKIYWSSEPVELDDFHVRMVCGDEMSNSYKDIPFYQAKLHLSAFLESLGFAKPSFELKGSKLFVDRGPKLIVSKITLIPPNQKLQNSLSSTIGATGTPALLDTIEKAASNFYKSIGYPCVKSVSRFDINSGEVELKIDSNESRKFGQIKVKDSEVFESELLKRFYAFKPSDFYNSKDLELTRRRTEESAVVSGTFFLTECQGPVDDDYISQDYVVGNSRVFKFGLGADTEGGPFTYLKWRSNRFTRHLGQLSASLTLSMERQSIRTEGVFYPTHHTPRLYYKIAPKSYRETLTGSTELEFSVPTYIGYTWDVDDLKINTEFGPNFKMTWFKELNGQSFVNDFNTSIELGLTVVSNAYEVSKIHANSGYLFQVSVDYRSPALGFFEQLVSSKLLYKKIFNLGHCLSSDCYFAIRQIVQNTSVAENVSIGEIPPSLRTHIGDVQTLRGYSIINSLNPGLSLATTSLELRLVPHKWDSLEPYLLFDIGKLGKRSFQYEPDTLSALGLGLRWFSPVGILNSFVTRSTTYNSTLDSQWYFFIGLGEGF